MKKLFFVLLMFLTCRVWADYTIESSTGISFTVVDSTLQVAVSNYDSLLKAATTFAGDVTGTFATTAVGNDSHNHTDATVTVTTGAVTGGTWTVDRGGTGATSAVNARTALGVAIGSNVQAYDADLDDLADGSLTGSKVGSGVPAANIAQGTNETVRVGTATISLSCSGNAVNITGNLPASQIAQGTNETVRVGTATISLSCSGNASNITGNLAASQIAQGTNETVRVGTATVSLSCSGNAVNITGNLPASQIAQGTNETVRVGTATVALSIAASNVLAGSLGSGVIASSIAVNAVYPASVLSGTYSNITLPAANVAAGSLGTGVIASSIAVNAVQDASIVGVSASKVAAGSLGASVICSSIAVNSVRRESLKDVCLDGVFAVFGSTTTAGTNAIRISKFFDSAITISTISACVVGGTSLAFNIEERTAPGTAGTDIWSSDVTATTTPWTGGTLGNAAIAANAALYLVPTTWTGAVNFVEIKGWATRD